MFFDRAIHYIEEGRRSNPNDPILLNNLSGIEAKIKTRYLIEWSSVAQWDPEARYNPVGTATRSAAALMIQSAETLLKVL